MTSTPRLLSHAEKLRRSRQTQAASKAYKNILDAVPDNTAALQGMALVSVDAGKLVVAEKWMLRAIQTAPESAELQTNMCEIYRRLGQYDHAVKHGRRAISLAPDSTRSHYNLAIAVADKGDREDAEQIYESIVEMDPAHNLAWNNLGTCYAGRDDEDAALGAYLKAATIDPNHAEAQNNAGAIFLERGELELARKHLIAAISAKEDFLEAHHNLSAVLDYTVDDPHYSFLETQALRQGSLDDDQRMRLMFSLGKAREDVGHHQLAFLAYDEANKMKRAILAYDEKRGQILCEKLTHAFDGVPCPAPQPVQAGAPIFILGMPRSGTSLIEQVLSSHSNIHGAGEVKDFHAAISSYPGVGPMLEADKWVPSLSQDDFINIGQSYRQKMQEYGGSALRVTDKMPGNFHYLGFICRALPEARVIHSMRDPMDSCLSNFTKLFREGMEFAYDLEQIGRYYNRYIEMMQYWDKVLPAGYVLHVPYEAMVADLEGQARSILDHVELGWDESCLKFFENRRRVYTASVTQVRKPIYTKSVARSERFGDVLLPLRKIVGSSYPHGLAQIPQVD